jgi:hypothetical protein
MPELQGDRGEALVTVQSLIDELEGMKRRGVSPDAPVKVFEPFDSEGPNQWVTPNIEFAEDRGEVRIDF